MNKMYRLLCVFGKLLDIMYYEFVTLLYRYFMNKYSCAFPDRYIASN